MARVTVEDCLAKIPNRFELVVVASQRALELSAGATLTVPKRNPKDQKDHKHAVLALLEIEEGTVNIEALLETAIKKAQRSFKRLNGTDDDAMDETLTEISEEEERLMRGQPEGPSRMRLYKDEEDLEEEEDEKEKDNNSFGEDNLDVTD